MNYTNTELWKLAEANKVFAGDLFEDQDGNIIIFTGKSFQSYNEDTSLLTERKYIGMCVGDIWWYAGEDSLQFHKDVNSDE